MGLVMSSPHKLTYMSWNDQNGPIYFLYFLLLFYISLFFLGSHKGTGIGSLAGLQPLVPRLLHGVRFTTGPCN